MGFFSGLGGSILSAGASLIGGLMTNDKNEDIANQANQFNAEQYAKRYQTTTADMMAAGLNPMLAYTQGAGSAPSATTIAMQNPAAGMASSAADVANIGLTNAQIENVKAQTAATAAQAAKTAAETPKKEVEGDLWKRVHNKMLDLVDGKTSSAQQGKRQGEALGNMTQENAEKLRQLYPDEFEDTRSPLHRFVDRVGEWNPFGF